MRPISSSRASNGEPASRNSSRSTAGSTRSTGRGVPAPRKYDIVRCRRSPAAPTYSGRSAASRIT